MNKANRRRLWKLTKRTFSIAVLILLPVMLFLLFRSTDWDEVFKLLSEYRLSTLLIGLAISFASYAVFSSFDVFSRFYIRHPLPSARQMFGVAFVCNAFNLNLSSLVGGVAMRFRLYSRLGISKPDIIRILTFSVVTNWYGNLLLSGLLFTSGLPVLPQQWSVGRGGLQAIGVLLLALCAAYLLACRFSRRRSWGWKRYRLNFPSWRLALAQAVLGSSNWALMALLLTVLLPDKASYPEVLATLLVSSMAGLVLRVPAGLGVLETVFIAVLRDSFSRGTLFAALIGYRVLYCLIPLLLACVIYLWLERRARVLKQQAEAKQSNAETPSPS
ncbi:Inner membrane protein YbhN [compost metagenome]